MNQAYVLDYVRTARGRGTPRGGLHHVAPLELVTGLLRALADRAPALADGVAEDVILGCAAAHGEQGANPARTAALLAGWGDGVPGVVVSRFCASGLDAVAFAAARIRAGDASLLIAGGVESASRVPADGGPLRTDAAMVRRLGAVHAGVAADLNATVDGFDRADLDAYAAESHHKAAAATQAGAFARSLVPIGGLAHDELIRPDTTPATLAVLRPAYADLGADGQDALALATRAWPRRVTHHHTAGTSPPPADAAALLVVGDLRAARAIGLAPRARIAASAVVAHDPVAMLTAGQEATATALRRAGARPGAVDVFEFAETFAGLCLRLRRDFDAGPERLNPAGGAIATGHPVGATGAITAGDCLENLERAAGGLGVACVSALAGLGVGVVLDRTG